MSRIYAVEYRYVTDQDEEMAKMRPSHRAFNGRLADRGLLLAAGPHPGTPQEPHPHHRSGAPAGAAPSRLGP